MDYLIALLHQVDQAGFKIIAGIQMIQITGVDFLGAKLGIAFQVYLPLAFISSSKFFLGAVLG